MRLRLLTISILCLSLFACGKKGPVRPLDAPVPGPVTAPSLFQQGDALLLGWQLPTANLDGSPLSLPPMVEIYRSSYDPNNDCSDCLDRAPLYLTIEPELPSPARRLGDRFLLVEKGLKAGMGYQYKLLARAADGSAGQPLLLRTAFGAPVPAPAGLQATPLDRSVQLSWQPVTTAAGEKLLGYRIYRRVAGAASPPLPLSAQPLSEPRFEDFAVENGQTYRYQLRAVVERDGQQVEGLPGGDVQATPKAPQ